MAANPLLLPAYSFSVVVDNKHLAFSEVSGLAVELETISYKHGLSFWEGEQIKSYKYEKPVTVTLKKGVVAGHQDLTFLYEWLKSRGPRQVAVNLVDDRGNPRVSWQIGKAIPVKLSAPTFDANSSEIAIDTFEMMALKISIIYT